MEKNIEISILSQIYKDILTEKQFEIAPLCSVIFTRKIVMDNCNIQFQMELSVWASV